MTDEKYRLLKKSILQVPWLSSLVIIVGLSAYVTEFNKWVGIGIMISFIVYTNTSRAIENLNPNTHD